MAFDTSTPTPLYLDAGALRDAAKAAARAVDPKSSIPTLRCFALRLTGPDALEINGTDMDRWTAATVETAGGDWQGRTVTPWDGRPLYVSWYG